ncbi:hypothetical protein IL306_012090, partial [Fusarium sp. DS 682]
MATVPELFVAVFATASVVLVTAILICWSPAQPLKPPKTESLTPIDDIPADHTDNLDRNPKSIVEHHPVLRRDAALAPKDKKSLTLRINDIPADQTDNLDRNLKSILEEVPDLQGDADTMVRRSLVPHGNDSLCATISIITSLSADDLSAQLRRAGNGYPYNYTCKFEGITPLYEDKNGADVDDDVWLRDFLSKDVPNIRVLLYGYDTTLPGSLSKQSIEDLGGALLEQIIAYRAGDGALVRARRRRSNANSNLSKASYGLLFFGVPNLGLRNDQLRTLVRGQPNEALIHDLLVDSDSEPSTFLKRLADQFSESCKGHYRVVTFFERTLSPTLELDQDGKWRKSGRPSLLVTEKSTTSTGLVAVAEEDNIALNTDHSGLVKYDSRSQGDYTIVRERLRRLVDEAKLEVSKRFAEHNLYQPLSETAKACLKSLAFEDMDGRQVKIDDAAEGTCKWLLNHKTLIEWTRQHRGLLWIKGKPGSGKSTLMKYARDALPSLYGTDTLAFSFFFHGRGHELQRTLLGLFRSLLHQLLCRVPGALPDLIENFEEKSKTVGEPGEKWQWHLQPLQAFLKLSLPRILRRFPVILFIDALDECGEQPAVELIGHLKHLLSSLPPTDSRFGIIFSCRHYPILELDGGLTILLDTQNAQDIVTFVQTQLSTNHLDANIGRLIINRARGVFMWAHLVLKQVLLLHLQGESTAQIEAEIDRIPQDLNGLYNELIKAMKHRSTTLRLMQWICFSTRPLTTDELRWAVAVDPDCTHKSLDECQRSSDFIIADKIDRRIKTLSCGLAEIVPSNNARIVQFIHQSVKDFFVERGLMALDNTTKEANLVVPVAHCRLSRTCIHYFRMAAHSHSQPFSQPDTFKFPFVRYAMKSLMSHIVLGKEAETSPRGLLDLLGWPRDSLIELWVHTYQQLEPVTADCPRSGTKLIHVISRYGLAELLSCLLQEYGQSGALVDIQDSWGRSPLSWAAEKGNEAVVKMLLDTGKVDVNSRDTQHGRSPLSWAARNRHKAVVKMLLDTGKVNVDSRDTLDGRSPLSWAAQNGNEAVVKMLLNTGKAEVDSRDKNGRSPLLWAAEKGNEAVVKLLLNTGKVNVDSRDKNGRSPLS